MSAERTARRLVRLYPPAWRERYGAELEELIVASAPRDHIPWRVRLDVVREAGHERLRASSLLAGGRDPRDRVRRGCVLVLWTWVCFLVAGTVVQKVSEHWQQHPAAARRATPAAAFAVLELAALAGSVCVLAAIAIAPPSVARALRAGGWSCIRRHVVRSGLLTAASAIATSGLVAWAHRLGDAQRNGGDVLYDLAFVACACVLVACLVSWTGAAAAAALQLELPPSSLRVQALLAAGAVMSMAAMTIATLLWWGTAGGRAAPPLDPRLAAAAAVMVLATALAGIGARRSLVAASELGSA
jgi:hypothetical protein